MRQVSPRPSVTMAEIGRYGRDAEGVEEAVLALQHRAGPEKALAPEQRRAQARLRRPAGMQTLGPGALGEVLDDAGRQAAGDAERAGQLRRRQAEGRADAGRRAERADHRGRMEAGAVDRGRRDQREAAHQLGPDHVAAQHVGALEPVLLGGGEHRRQDHGAGVHRGALEAVVEVLAMRRGAVDQRGAGGIQAAGVAERGAGARTLPGGERGADVVGVPGGDAQARDVEQRIGRDRAPRLGDCLGPEPGRPVGKDLRDRRSVRHA